MALDWFGVRRGELWWQYDSHHGAMSNEDEPDTFIFTPPPGEKVRPANSPSRRAFGV